MNNKELVFEIQELDRKRIARDLHDTSLQNLTHLIHKLELVSMYIDKDVIKAKLEIMSISNKINLIVDEIRDIIYDLRPMVFDDLGLKDTIMRFIDKIKENTDIIIHFDIDDIEMDDKSFLLGIFRILQESVENSCKYSQAQNMNIILKEYQNKIELVVEDDGKGFDLEKAKKKENHFGLFLMEERVEMLSGKLNINTSPENGTKIHVLLQKH